MTSEQEENVKIWVKALRSGEYEQAQGALWDGQNGYCCLGVVGKAILGFEGLDFTYTAYNRNPYKKIKEALGLSSNFGEYVDGVLSQHNDMDGWDFKKIADLIESRPEGLFIV